MDLMKKVEEGAIKKSPPSFRVGDTVKVDVTIKEGDKTRIQPFEGIVIGRKGGGINETFTVRRISYGEGVERIFFLHSPHIKGIKVLSHGNVRRAKLYYLRSRLGKKAKVKEKHVVEEETKETT
ncbi:MAG: 50S ribosomal protein L19 [Candidatus Omnitrophica bacterium]|nr:50S ribosomal protein L19 [Candidatus Omnitrophota bacterium]